MGEYNPLERNYVFQYNYDLNVEAMADAIKVFVGEHDFRAFVTDNKELIEKTTIINNLFPIPSLNQPIPIHKVTAKP